MTSSLYSPTGKLEEAQIRMVGKKLDNARSELEAADAEHSANKFALYLIVNKWQLDAHYKTFKRPLYSYDYSKW